MDAERKRLRAQYKSRVVEGGVFRFVNPRIGYAGPIRMTADFHKEHNRLQFAKDMNNCIENELRPLWQQHGPDGFAVQVVDTLIKKPDQSEEDFRAELITLLALHRQQ